MEQYTDDERVEDLKKWWKENGASIIIGLLLGLVAIFGWRYWTTYRNTQAEAASQAYDVFLVAAAKPEAGAAREPGQALLSDFPRSPYTALAALRLAKSAAESGDDASARQWLEWVIANANLDELKDIARLRLARVKLAAGQTAEASQLLEAIRTASLNAEREALRGDLYLAGNQPEQARTAYTAALAAGGDRFLQLKLDNLTAAAPETVVPIPAGAPPTESSPVPPATPPAAAAEPASSLQQPPAPGTATTPEPASPPEQQPSPETATTPEPASPSEQPPLPAAKTTAELAPAAPEPAATPEATPPEQPSSDAAETTPEPAPAESAPPPATSGQ